MVRFMKMLQTNYTVKPANIMILKHVFTEVRPELIVLTHSNSEKQKKMVQQ